MWPKKSKHRKHKQKPQRGPGKAVPRNHPVKPENLPPIAEKAEPLVILRERPRAIIVLFIVGLILFFMLGLILITVGQLKPADAYVRPAFPWIVTILGILCCVPALVALFVYGAAFIEAEVNKLVAVFGAIFLIVLIIVVLVIPNPTEFPMLVFRVILALAAACVGAVIPGILQIKSRMVRATSASAFFATVFFFNPAALTKLIK